MDSMQSKSPRRAVVFIKFENGHTLLATLCCAPQPLRSVLAAALLAHALTMQQQPASGPADVLAQLTALRFFIAPRAVGSDALTPDVDALAEKSERLTWGNLQHAARSRHDVRHDTWLWLHQRGTRTHEPVPLRLALLGAVAVPGLSAVAPACKYDRLPKVWRLFEQRACAFSFAATTRPRNPTSDTRATRPGAAQNASDSVALATLKMHDCVARRDFHGVSAVLMRKPSQCCLFSIAFTAVYAAVVDCSHARAAALAAGFLELTTNSLSRHMFCAAAVGDAADLIGVLAEGGLAPQDVTVHAVNAVCVTLGFALMPDVVPWMRLRGGAVFGSCVYALSHCFGLCYRDPEYDAAVDRPVAKATRAAACCAALAMGAPSFCIAVVGSCVSKDQRKWMGAAGNCLRLLLARHEPVWRECGSNGVRDMLRDAMALMHEHAACTELQRLVVHDVFLPLAMHEMMERNSGTSGAHASQCVGICCAVHGRGAPRALAALLEADVVLALAKALRMHAAVRAPVGRLLAFLVQDNTGARRAVLHADVDGALFDALAAAHDATIADPSAGTDEAYEEEESWDPQSALGAALCLLTLTSDGVAAAAAAKRIAAAARCSAELLAEEEAEKAVTQHAAATASKKKGSRARRAARNAAAAAELEEDEQEPDQEVDAAAMAHALRRTAARPAVARAPESRAAAATASLASLRIRQALPAASGSSAAAADPCARPCDGCCHPPSGADEAHEDDELCVCCLDAPRDTPLSGCVGVHPPAVCAFCAARLLSGPAPSCPLCRAPAAPRYV
jgi:hypothetical protein